MKSCPQCGTVYSDDTLIFCLQDGTALIKDQQSSPETPTVAFGDKTEILPVDIATGDFSARESAEQYSANKDANPMRIELPKTGNWEQSTATQIAEPRRKNSNTLVAVLATALVMLVVFGIAGVGAWFFFLKEDAAKTSEIANDNSSIPKNNALTNVRSSNENKKESVPSASKEKTPEKTFDLQAEKKAVTDRIFAWKSASEALNLDSHMDNYGDTIDYYSKNRVSKNVVRKDRQRAFDKYFRITITLSNMDISIDQNGSSATAVFDKAWIFKGVDDDSEGKVKSRLTLSKIGDDWKITGEKDLKVYFVK